MKRSILVSVIAMVMFAGSALAQGRGRGLPLPPALTGPVADLVNGIINAINKQIKGTVTMTFKKTGNDWQVVLVHASINGPAIASH